MRDILEAVDELELLSRITVDPEKFGGKPCIRGIRMRVIDVLDLLSAGETTQEILAEYPYLEVDDIRACLAYARDRVAELQQAG